MLYLAMVFYLGYWHYWFGTDDRTIAVLEALEMPIHPPDDYIYRPCVGDGVSADNRQCFILKPQDRGYCRWWILERCHPYAISSLVLADHDKLGEVLDAVLHPCTYLTRQNEFSRSYLRDDCEKPEALKKTPIIIIFNDGSKDIKIRIDW